MDLHEQHRIRHKSGVRLKKIDPQATPGFDGDEAAARLQLAQLRGELDELQAKLYAQHQHKVLMVLQAMDTGGKDGVIRSIFDGVNPQGVHIANFKVPTPIERDHDFLWRAHAQAPPAGEIVVFNRSHYEDVLVVRVHELVPKSVWQARYAQIAAFENALAAEGTTILKFYLHIDKKEQKQRLQARLDDPAKHWKFNVGDLKERELWDDYMSAYEDAINETTSKAAPWYVVPANHKWYRDLVIASALVDALKALKVAYPENAQNLSGVTIR